MLHGPPRFRTLVVLLAVQNAQDREEQVDNVQVQADRGGNLLLNVVLPHDQLGIHEDIPAEDQRSQTSIDQLTRAAVWEEHGHEAEQHEAPQAAKEVGHPAGEVIFCLAGERCEEDEDAAGKQHGVEDDGGLIEGDDDGDGVGLEKSETGEEEQVSRVRMALPVGENHESDGAEHL